MPWRPLYPFASRFFATEDGHRMHYVEEGPSDGSPMILLHGNPTWSFFYRNLISAAAKTGYRALAPDMIGYGLSEKPQHWEYRLARHIANTEAWLEERKATKDGVLVCHDWGGPIGLGVAIRHPDWFQRIVLMNTAAFLSRDCPRRIWLCRCPVLGEILVRGLNLFVPAATRLAPARPLPKEVRKGYLFPYRSWHDRIGPLAFIRDLPMRPSDPSRPVFMEIEKQLPSLRNKSIQLIWGGRDFCLHTGFLKRWKTEFFPEASVHCFPEAGHYLLEDAPEKILPLILHPESFSPRTTTL